MEKQAFDYLKEQINIYIQDRDDNKNKDSVFCWCLENSIGMGKTTFTEKLFCDLVQDYFDNINSAVPMLIHARDINGSDFSQWFEMNFRDDVDFISALRNSCRIKKRKFILIVDGLDELNYQILEPLLDQCSFLLLENVFLLLTSRPVNAIATKINDKIPQTARIELYYKDETLFELLNFPPYVNNLIKDFILSIILDSPEKLRDLQSPFLFSLISNYLKNLKTNNANIRIARTFPISLSSLLKEYYYSLISYSKLKGKIPPTITLKEIIDAGKIFAKKLFLDESGSKYDNEFMLLQKIGLIVSDIDNPRFSHLIFEYDLLARAIASGNPAFTPAEIFQIMSREKSLQFNICEHAIKMVLSKELEKDDILLDITDESFDIFEHLYEDNSIHFSKLKAFVWIAREKGPTALINYIYNYILGLEEYPTEKDDFYFIYSQILRKININFPNHERKLLEQNKIKILLDLEKKISEENLPLFIEKIREFNSSFTENEKESNREYSRYLNKRNPFWLLDNLFKSIVWLNYPLDFLLDLIPELFFDLNYLAAIEMFYDDQKEEYHQKLFMKSCSNPDREVLSKYLELLIEAPFLLPDLSKIEDKQSVENLSPFFLKTNKSKPDIKWHLSHSTPMQQILDLILINALRLKDYNKALQIFYNYENYYGTERFTSILKQNRDLFNLITNFIEDFVLPALKEESRDTPEAKTNLAKNNKATFLYDYWNWFIKTVLEDDTLLRDYINLNNTPDNLATLLKRLDIAYATSIIGGNVPELWKSLCMKLKKVLKNTNPDAYRNLILNFQYNSFERKKPIEYMFMWCDEIDLIEYNILEKITDDTDNMISSHFSHRIFYIYSDSALKYIIKHYITLIMKNNTLSYLKQNLIRELRNFSIGRAMGDLFSDFKRYDIDFSSFLKEVTNEEDPITFINDCFKTHPPESLLNAFWELIFNMIKKVATTGDKYRSDNDWNQILEFSPKFPIIDSFIKKIMKEDLYITEFLNINPNGIHIHPSIDSFLNTVIQQKSALVRQYIQTHKSYFRIHESYTLFEKLFNYYEIYEDFIIDQVAGVKNLYSLLSDKNIRFLMNQRNFVKRIINSAPPKIDDIWAFQSYSTPIDIIKSILRENKTDPRLYEFYKQYLDEEPIKWLPPIEEAQKVSIEELKKFKLLK